jgi:serine/threonine protein kinase
MDPTRELSLNAAFPAPADVARELPSGVFAGARSDPESLRASVAATVAEVAVGQPSAQRKRRKQRLAAHKGLPDIGTVIHDKYLLDEVVGAGGFGVVYRATHLLLHMPVAIKLLHPDMVKKHPTLPEMLCNEARLAARVSHGNVVRVLDATQTRELTYVVMEFIDGSTLADAIDEKGALSVELAVRIGIDVASGLQAARATGLIHRDIKPSNILLNRAGEAKIVDLGLARLSIDLAERRERGLVGTPGYMAPELGMPGVVVDHRGDMYSLGVTLYEIVSGKLPFPDDDAYRCLLRHRSEAIAPLHEVRPGTPLAFSRLVTWLLGKQPAQRPVSYDVLVDHLRRVFDLPLR